MAEASTHADIKSLVDQGELLAAVDAARKLVERLPKGEMRHLVQIEEIIALARMGSHDEATERYEAYGLAGSDVTSARSLKARFAKDIGLAAPEGPERQTTLRESRDAYHALAVSHSADGSVPNRGDFEYNAINAVTLSHFLGDMGPVAAIIDDLQANAPMDSYYSWATRAELLLVLGAPVEAIAAALKTARSLPGAAPGPIATTLRQLSKIDADNPALAALRPGPVLHYSGHMITAPDQPYGRILARHEAELKQRVEAKLAQIAPSVVFGSLASGVDILVVEWALRTGRAARVFLPFGDADFFAESVQKAGVDWARRGWACIAHPMCTRTYLTQAPMVQGDSHAFAAVSAFAMGSAILRAERDHAFAEQLVVWDGADAGGVAGAAADRRMWPSGRLTQHEVLVADLGAKDPFQAKPAAEPVSDIVKRTPKALIFGDVKNFSKLGEHQLPDFVNLVMGAARSVFDSVEADYPRALALSNTWGDGIFAVYDHAAPAAAFALRLQARMVEMKPELAARGLPDDLAIRLGLHYGVVYPMHEPVTGRPNFFGEAVARAARIEPVTQAGRTFVSEEFAAALALQGDSPAAAEYVGEVDAAKGYGRFRLYRIRPV